MDVGPPAPARLVHLGLGNFFRAHQAWYVRRLPDAEEWGIAAFTGRRRELADALRPQDGLYTLITRGADGDRAEVIGSVVSVHPADDHAAWLRQFRSPQLAALTMTVTEAAYTQAVRETELVALQRNATAPVTSVPARVLAGIVERDRAGGDALVIMPCDNIPRNGDRTERLMRELASRIGPEPERAIERSAVFVDTVVDRITPRATADDSRTVLAAIGLVDAAPVVTEPFCEWVIGGPLPAGQPRWQESGATIVDDVLPYQRRKLLLLNGGHSLLAYLGSLRGHHTVAEALADPACREWLDEWWDEAGRHLAGSGIDLSGYRRALLGRFGNPRIAHRLEQIAADGSQKLPVRIVPVLRSRRAAGRESPAAVEVLAAWICHLRGRGAPVNDPAATKADPGGRLDVVVPRLLRLLDVELAGDPGLVTELVRRVRDLERLA